MQNAIEITNFPKLNYAANEAMNTLATNLAFCGNDVRVIAISSRFAKEGKSFVSMNLMRTYASLQKRVVLIDADLRRSNLVQRHQMHFVSENTNGLAQYLAGMCSVEDIVYATNIPDAYFVPVGRLVNSSLQLLTKDLFGKLVELLSQNFDIVLIDTPPTGTIIDAVEISKHCDGALLVVGYGVGDKREINDVASAIERTGCPVLGIAMNKIDMGGLTNRKYYYANHYYGYYGRKQYGADDINKAASQKKRKTKA